MGLTRRQFLALTATGASGLAFEAGALAGGAPLVRSRTVRGVARTVAGVHTADGAGVRLTRIIGQPGLPDLDPIVLLDRMHSSNPADYLRGFPDHPHRGFETVTVMLEGRFRHRDSRGNHGVLVGGGAQWMTAGRGIVHSEMPDPPDHPGDWLSAFQFWVNLPAREKMRAQEYQDLQPERLAAGRLSSGGALRIIAGRHDGLHGPVRERTTEPLLATVALEDDRPLELEAPRGHAAMVFVHAGEAEVGPERAPTRVPADAVAILDEGDRIRLRAPTQRTVVIVAAGKPLREPVARRGPFVMNTEAELDRAWADYRAGVLDKT